MSDRNMASVRRMFVDRYYDMRERLSRRLGSVDLAGDALHDAWIRLAQTNTIGTIQSPQSYLFRVVLNAADDHRRKERRHFSATTVEDLLEVPDEAPTPEAVILAKSELAAFEVVLATFSARRRAIFLAARLHNVPRQVIADRLGVSRRLVAKELLAAHLAFVEQFREIED